MDAAKAVMEHASRDAATAWLGGPLAMLEASLSLEVRPGIHSASFDQVGD